MTPVTAGNSANRFCERWAHPCCLLPHHQRKFVSLSFIYKKCHVRHWKGFSEQSVGFFILVIQIIQKSFCFLMLLLYCLLSCLLILLFVLSFSQQQIELWQAAFSILNPKLRKFRGVYILLLLILTRFHMWRMKPNQSWLHKINFETILSLLMLVCRDMRLKL